MVWKPSGPLPAVKGMGLQVRGSVSERQTRKKHLPGSPGQPAVNWLREDTGPQACCDSLIALWFGGVFPLAGTAFHNGKWASGHPHSSSSELRPQARFAYESRSPKKKLVLA